MPRTKKQSDAPKEAKPKRESIKGLKEQIEKLSTDLLTMRGETVSFKMNAELTRRKMESAIFGLKKECDELKKRNHDLSVAFGEFKCRELLWLASQWVRNAKFDIKVNGNTLQRKVMVGQIDAFLKGWTFTGGGK